MSVLSPREGCGVRVYRGRRSPGARARRSPKGGRRTGGRRTRRRTLLPDRDGVRPSAAACAFCACTFDTTPPQQRARISGAPFLCSVPPPQRVVRRPRRTRPSSPVCEYVPRTERRPPAEPRAFSPFISTERVVRRPPPDYTPDSVGLRVGDGENNSNNNNNKQ